MDTLGALLRGRRETKKFTLEYVAEKTKISSKYLKALEEDDTSVFPGEVYQKGFLRIYAQFLGLDPEKLLLQYKESKLTKNLAESRDRRENRDEKRYFRFFEKAEGWKELILEWLKKIARSWIFYLILIAVILFLLVRWFFFSDSVVTVPGAAPEENLPKEAILTEPSSVATSDKISPPRVEENEIKKDLHLEVEAVEDVWIQITRNERAVPTEEILLKPGQRISWKAEKEIKVKAGNAGGLNLWLNGNQLPLLGKKGEVVVKTFTTKDLERKE